jgi:hypothetical protein
MVSYHYHGQCTEAKDEDEWLKTRATIRDLLLVRNFQEGIQVGELMLGQNKNQSCANPANPILVRIAVADCHLRAGHYPEAISNANKALDSQQFLAKAQTANVLRLKANATFSLSNEWEKLLEEAHSLDPHTVYVDRAGSTSYVLAWSPRNGERSSEEATVCVPLLTRGPRRSRM